MRKTAPGFLFRHRSSIALCSSLLFLLQSLAAPFAEAGFWEDRRKSAVRPAVAFLPASPAGGETVLRDFPRADPRLPLRSADGVSGFSQALPPALENLLRALPPQSGDVRGVSRPPHPRKELPLVLHVHDAHRNVDAQRNISAAIQALAAAGQLKGVALEGAAGPLPPPPAVSDAGDMRAVAEVLLEEKDLTGPMHALLSAPILLPAFGVDDDVLYERNVGAYLGSLKAREAALARIDGARREVAAQKPAVYSAELLRFDQEVEAYRRAARPLGDYLKTLDAHWPSGTPRGAVRSFLEVKALEDALDFAKAERERAEALRALSARLPSADLELLTRWAMALRAGAMTHGDFYRSFQTLFRKAGLSLDTFPEFQRYARYVIAADRINPEALFQQAEAVEKQIYRSLAPTPAAAALVARGRSLCLGDKLARFSLNPVEWREYAAFPLGDMGDLSSFEEFYRSAQARDRVMADNVLRRLPRGEGVVVLVTGGFHAQGMAPLLAEQGVTVASFVPRIAQLKDGASDYLSYFERDKTPIEKLVAGEQLSLSQRPWTPALAAKVAALYAAIRPEQASERFHAVAGGILAAVKAGAVGMLRWVKLSREGGTVELRFNWDGERIVPGSLSERTSFSVLSLRFTRGAAALRKISPVSWPGALYLRLPARTRGQKALKAGVAGAAALWESLFLSVLVPFFHTGALLFPSWAAARLGSVQGTYSLSDRLRLGRELRESWFADHHTFVIRGFGRERIKVLPGSNEARSVREKARDYTRPFLLLSGLLLAVTATLGATAVVGAATGFDVRTLLRVEALGGTVAWALAGALSAWPHLRSNVLGAYRGEVLGMAGPSGREARLRVTGRRSIGELGLTEIPRINPQKEVIITKTSAFVGDMGASGVAVNWLIDTVLDSPRDKNAGVTVSDGSRSVEFLARVNHSMSRSWVVAAGQEDALRAILRAAALTIAESRFGPTPFFFWVDSSGVKGHPKMAGMDSIKPILTLSPEYFPVSVFVSGEDISLSFVKGDAVLEGDHQEKILRTVADHLKTEAAEAFFRRHWRLLSASSPEEARQDSLVPSEVPLDRSQSGKVLAQEGALKAVLVGTATSLPARLLSDQSFTRHNKPLTEEVKPALIAWVTDKLLGSPESARAVVRLEDGDGGVEFRAKVLRPGLSSWTYHAADEAGVRRLAASAAKRMEASGEALSKAEGEVLGKAGPSRNLLAGEGKGEEMKSSSDTAAPLSSEAAPQPGETLMREIGPFRFFSSGGDFEPIQPGDRLLDPDRDDLRGQIKNFKGVVKAAVLRGLLHHLGSPGVNKSAVRVTDGSVSMRFESRKAEGLKGWPWVAPASEQGKVEAFFRAYNRYVLENEVGKLPFAVAFVDSPKTKGQGAVSEHLKEPHLAAQLRKFLRTLPAKSEFIAIFTPLGELWLRTFPRAEIFEVVEAPDNPQSDSKTLSVMRFLAGMSAPRRSAWDFPMFMKTYFSAPLVHPDAASAREEVKKMNEPSITLRIDRILSALDSGAERQNEGPPSEEGFFAEAGPFRAVILEQRRGLDLRGEGDASFSRYNKTLVDGLPEETVAWIEGLIGEASPEKAVIRLEDGKNTVILRSKSVQSTAFWTYEEKDLGRMRSLLTSVNRHLLELKFGPLPFSFVLRDSNLEGLRELDRSVLQEEVRILPGLKSVLERLPSSVVVSLYFPSGELHLGHEGRSVILLAPEEGEIDRDALHGKLEVLRRYFMPGDKGPGMAMRLLTPILAAKSEQEARAQARDISPRSLSTSVVSPPVRDGAVLPRSHGDLRAYVEAGLKVLPTRRTGEKFLSYDNLALHGLTSELALSWLETRLLGEPSIDHAVIRLEHGKSVVRLHAKVGNDGTAVWCYDEGEEPALIDILSVVNAAVLEEKLGPRPFSFWTPTSVPMYGYASFDSVFKGFPRAEVLKDILRWMSSSNHLSIVTPLGDLHVKFENGKHVLSVLDKEELRDIAHSAARTLLDYFLPSGKKAGAAPLVRLVLPFRASSEFEGRAEVVRISRRNLERAALASASALARVGRISVLSKGSLSEVNLPAVNPKTEVGYNVPSPAETDDWLRWLSNPQLLGRPNPQSYASVVLSNGLDTVTFRARADFDWAVERGELTALQGLRHSIALSRFEAEFGAMPFAYYAHPVLADGQSSGGGPPILELGDILDAIHPSGPAVTVVLKDGSLAAYGKSEDGWRLCYTLVDSLDPDEIRSEIIRSVEPRMLPTLAALRHDLSSASVEMARAEAGLLSSSENAPGEDHISVVNSEPMTGSENDLPEVDPEIEKGYDVPSPTVDENWLLWLSDSRFLGQPYPHAHASVTLSDGTDTVTFRARKDAHWAVRIDELDALERLLHTIGIIRIQDHFGSLPFSFFAHNDGHPQEDGRGEPVPAGLAEILNGIGSSRRSITVFLKNGDEASYLKSSGVWRMVAGRNPHEVSRFLSTFLTHDKLYINSYFWRALAWPTPEEARAWIASSAGGGPAIRTGEPAVDEAPVVNPLLLLPEKKLLETLRHKEAAESSYFTPLRPAWGPWEDLSTRQKAYLWLRWLNSAGRFGEDDVLGNLQSGRVSDEALRGLVERLLGKLNAVREKSGASPVPASAVMDGMKDVPLIDWYTTARHGREGAQNALAWGLDAGFWMEDGVRWPLDLGAAAWDSDHRLGRVKRRLLFLRSQLYPFSPLRDIPWRAHYEKVFSTLSNGNDPQPRDLEALLAAISLDLKEKSRQDLQVTPIMVAPASEQRSLLLGARNLFLMNAEGFKADLERSAGEAFDHVSGRWTKDAAQMAAARYNYLARQLLLLGGHPSKDWKVHGYIPAGDIAAISDEVNSFRRWHGLPEIPLAEMLDPDLSVRPLEPDFPGLDADKLFDILASGRSTHPIYDEKTYGPWTAMTDSQRIAHRLRWLRTQRYPGHDVEARLKNHWAPAQIRAYLRYEDPGAGLIPSRGEMERYADLFKNEHVDAASLADMLASGINTVRGLMPEFRDAVRALRGRPGDLRDILLAFKGEEMTGEEVRVVTRGFEEFKLAEVSAGGAAGGRKKSSSENLLSFFLSKAGDISKMDERKRQALVNIFAHLAFRDMNDARGGAALMKHLRELSEGHGLFFQELYEESERQVREAMSFKAPHLKTELRPYQRLAAYFLSHRRGAHIGDDVGTGKTLEVLADIDPAKKTVIVAPASLRGNWVKEILKHFKPEVLKGMSLILVDGEDSPSVKKLKLQQIGECTSCIAIVGTEFLRKKTDADLEPLNRRTHTLVIDENQKAANFRGEGRKANSQQAEGVMKLQAERVRTLSATPAGANLETLFATLYRLHKGGPEEHRFRDFNEFKKQYNPATAAGLEALRLEMRLVSLSRRASEVLDEAEDPSQVPFSEQGPRLPRLREVDPAEMGGFFYTPEQEKIILMMLGDFRAFARWYNEHRPADAPALTENHMNPFDKLRFILMWMTDPRQVGGQDESPLWKELARIKDHYDRQGRKGVFFTRRIQALERTEEILSRGGAEPVAEIRGGDTGVAHDDQDRPVRGYMTERGEWSLDAAHPQARALSRREYNLQRFQNDPAVKDAAVMMQAGGMGLDLTAGSYEVHVELPLDFATDVQIGGRTMRADEARPRFEVDRIRMVGRFRPGLAERFAGTAYEDLAREYEKLGSPHEIVLKRLQQARRAQRYVLDDLGDKNDEALVANPIALMKLLPGAEGDAAIKEYRASIANDKVRQAVEIFGPWQGVTADDQERSAVLALASLYYERGVIAPEDVARIKDLSPEVRALIVSLGDISNKFVRHQWVGRVAPVVQEAGERVNGLGFLQEEAPFLILPLLSVFSGPEAEGELRAVAGLLGEIQRAQEYAKLSARKILYQRLSAWLASAPSTDNARFHAAFTRFQPLLLNDQLPVAARVQFLERFLRLAAHQEALTRLTQVPEGAPIFGWAQALEEAAVETAANLFGMSPVEARRLTSFPALLSALKMQKGLMENPLYQAEAARLAESMRHVAAGDFDAWRNLQKGERLAGANVDFLRDDPDFYEAFTRPETISVDDANLVGENAVEALRHSSAEVLKMITQNDFEAVAAVDGEPLRKPFSEHWEKGAFPRAWNEQRRRLNEALQKERKGRGWSPADREFLRANGIAEEGAADELSLRLDRYYRLEQWFELKAWLAELQHAPPTAPRRAELKMLLGRLMGRMRDKGLAEYVSPLDDLQARLDQVNVLSGREKLAVRFTTDPAELLERDMLSPELVGCMNADGNPKHYSTVVDDLSSRNKILAIVEDENGRPLGRAIVKVKRLEDGRPVVFVEKPLGQGAVPHEDVILAALQKSKMPVLEEHGARLARARRRDGEVAVNVYETGGYSAREYFEPLFGIRDRTKGRGVYHPAVLLPATTSAAKAHEPGIHGLFGAGHGGMPLPEFLAGLKKNGVQVVVDVRANPHSRFQPDYNIQQLRDALAKEGIAYRHLPEFGSPAELRTFHQAGRNDAEFREAYRRFLDGKKESLESLAADMQGKSLCLLCAEKDPLQCHRQVMMEALTETHKVEEAKDLRTGTFQHTGDQRKLPGVNSLLYLMTRSPLWGAAGLAMEIPLMLLVSRESSVLAWLGFAAAHVLLKRFSQPGRPLASSAADLLIHAGAALPYFLFGALDGGRLGGAAAAAAHVLYDAVLIWRDQGRLAREDLRELRGLNALLPPVASQRVDDLDGRRRALEKMSGRARFNPAYALALVRERGGGGFTGLLGGLLADLGAAAPATELPSVLAHVSLVMEEDLPGLEKTLAEMSRAPQGAVLLVSPASPAVSARLERLVRGRRGVIFIDAQWNGGLMQLSSAQLLAWAREQGSVRWSLSRNARALLDPEALAGDLWDGPLAPLKELLLAPLSFRLEDFQKALALALAVSRYA